MDIASFTLSASATSSNKSLVQDYYTVTVPVTAVSGTSPTLDLIVQEYNDRLAAWSTVYAFPRISATGRYTSPVIKRWGSRIRYGYTLGGSSTPTVTFSVSQGAALKTETPAFITQIIDRALTINTINSTTAAVLTKGVTNATLQVRMGAITTTAPQFKIQGSLDGTNWYDLSTALTSVASSTVQITVNNVKAESIRAIISTAGSGATLGEVTLRTW